MTMTLVSTITSPLTSSVSFTNIPQTGTDLYGLFSVRGSQAFDFDNLQVRFNGDSAGNYLTISLRGNGSTVTSVYSQPGFTDTRSIASVPGGNFTANTFSNISMYLPNYALTGAKSVSFEGTTENAAQTSGMSINAGGYLGTSPITSITFSHANFVAGCTFSLYSITKGSGGATVA